MISIQAAHAGDYPALLALWRRSVEATHEFLTAADVDEIEQDVADCLPQMPDLKVAVQSGTIVGFIAASGASVEMLFVDPDAQGRGIGTALLDTAAAEHDVVRVDVNEQNASGRAFYTARGFSEVGRSELDGEGRPFPILHLQLMVPKAPVRPA